MSNVSFSELAPLGPGAPPVRTEGKLFRSLWPLKRAKYQDNGAGLRLQHTTVQRTEAEDHNFEASLSVTESSRLVWWGVWCLPLEFHSFCLVFLCCVSSLLCFNWSIYLVLFYVFIICSGSQLAGRLKSWKEKKTLSRVGLLGEGTLDRELNVFCINRVPWARVGTWQLKYYVFVWL